MLNPGIMLMRTPIDLQREPRPEPWRSGARIYLITVAIVVAVVVSTLALALLGSDGRAVLSSPDIVQLGL